MKTWLKWKRKRRKMRRIRKNDGNSVPHLLLRNSRRRIR
jgi:hypothetical protein